MRVCCIYSEGGIRKKGGETASNHFTVLEDANLECAADYNKIVVYDAATLFTTKLISYKY